MLVDQAHIIVRSGRGGDGCVSFRREKYIPKGGPDGGDGGDGGSVILLADPEVETLLDFAGRHHWFAPKGGPGGPKDQHGKNGEDLAIHLPAGTLVYDAQSGALLADLATPGQRVVIAQGGRGGFGNTHFKSATDQAPRRATPGGEAQELGLRLELKLIADVGLVGKPNAGKSTLLSRVSRATPRIADYPFTTLVPQLGIAELPGHRRVVLADIPGLIADAHKGHGLGTRFLRHVERTRLLVHLLELDPSDGSDPLENYRVIRRELEAYSPVLASKPEIVALSKMDTLGSPEDARVAVELIESGLGKPVLRLSSVTGQGLGELLEACWERIGEPERLHTRWSSQAAPGSADAAEPADAPPPARPGGTDPAT